jgi:hypothetical protein
MDVMRRFSIKPASVATGKLTLVKSNPLSCESAVQQFTQAVSAIPFVVTEMDAAELAQMVPSEVAGALPPHSEESNKVPAPDAESTLAANAESAPTVSVMEGDPAEAGGAVEASTVDVEASSGMQAEGSINLLADLVAEVKRLRFLLEAAMAAMSQ